MGSQAHACPGHEIHLEPAHECAEDGRRGCRECAFQHVLLFVGQYRILIEGSTTGSTDLEQVCEASLTRIGCMVAVVASWKQPVCLSRILTVFEQFVA